MIRLNNITKQEGIECEVVIKCEFLNPNGSVKDRIAKRMVMTAEKEGKLKRGDCLIEPTSGNTGLGLAAAAAARGYKCIICLLEKMSNEKIDALRGLGAEVVKRPTNLSMYHADGIVGTSLKLQKRLRDRGDGAEILNQYSNPSNPIAHYMTTGKEIYDQCGGKLDYLVVGMGTGGTMTGISRKLKELDPNIKVVGVDPPGSIMSGPEHFKPSAPGGQVVEGIGYDFFPRVFDQSGADFMELCPDKESFVMARRVMKEEGLMVGGSSGSAIYAAFEFIKKNKIGKGKRVVVVCPDNIRNYMTKHLNPDWMYERGYISEKECADLYTTDLVPNDDWGQKFTVGDLTNMSEARFVDVSMTCGEALKLMKETKFDQFPVKDSDGEIVGALTDKNLLMRVSKQQLKLTDSIQTAMVRDIRHVSKTTSLNELARVLFRNGFVLVEKKYIVTTSDVMDAMADPKFGHKTFDG
jgi:cystathionine beta-synthase